jgi:hypothetical protein
VLASTTAPLVTPDKILFNESMIITQDSLLEVAAKLLDYPQYRKWKKETELRKFRSFFGCSTVTAADLWNRIESRLKNRSLPKHLLWSLVFLKTYATEEVHCRMVNWPDPKQYREWVWYILEKIVEIKGDIIKLENRFDGVDFRKPPAQNCYISVDCFDCPIHEPWPFRPLWYSQKINGPGVKYEVGICITTSHIVWFNGPFPAGENDATIFAETLGPMLCDDEGAEVDGGYMGNKKMKNPTVAKSRKDRKEKSVVRGRHEIHNSRLKIYNVFNVAFRHTGKHGERDEELLRKHGLCGNAVAIITQLGYLNGEKIFDVDYGVEYW